MRRIYFACCIAIFIVSLSFGNESEEIGFLLFQPNRSDQFVNEEQAYLELNTLTNTIMGMNLNASQIYVYGYAAIADIDIDPKNLSRERAAFVVSELIKRGISENLFAEMVGHGAVSLWGDNSSEYERRLNRRAKILISGNRHIAIHQDGSEIASADQNITTTGNINILEEGTANAESEGSGFRFRWWMILILLAILGLAGGNKKMRSMGGERAMMENTSDFETRSQSDAPPAGSNPSRMRMPATGYKGERGNSDFMPDLDKEPKRFNYPTPMSWAQIIEGNKDFINRDAIIPEEIKKRLNNAYNRILNGNEGIPFKNGDVDFSQLSIATVTIDNFTTERYGLDGNMYKADIEAAKQFNMSTEEFIKWRNSNELMWHERKSMGIMDLISHDIHDNIDHIGGISEKKNMN